MNTRLWYNKASENWKDALALGNGRIGAMFFGTPDCERIEVNEESLWSGRPLEEECNITPEIMKQIQDLLFQEEFEEAWKIAKQYYIAAPNRIRAFQSFVNIFVDFEDKQDAQDYYKYLELSTAIAGAEYTKGGAKYVSECFASEKYDALIYRIKTDGKPFDCTLSLGRDAEEQDIFRKNLVHTREKDHTVKAIDDNTLVMQGRLTFEDDAERGTAGTGMDFISLMKVKTDGKCAGENETIKVSGATYFELCAVFETNYDVKRFVFDRAIDIKSRAEEKCKNAFNADYDEIKKLHIKDHSEIFDGFSFELNSDKERLNLPTDELIQRAREGEFDYGYVELYLNFTRYLLTECAGKNATLPANLQGIWATGFNPPWCSDYHTNINMQMNYWPVETVNIKTAFEPFLHFVKMISLFGVETAKKIYNARGWTVHHNTDVFGRCGVHDRVECGAFPMAGPWLCLNIWEHYEYTNDADYLAEIYPILKGSCRFMLDFLVESPEGYLVTNPSNSPENEFFYYDKNGEKKKSMFTYGATMDFAIIKCIFSRTIAACQLLSKDEDFAKELSDALAKLPPFRVSERYGTVCEWIKDYEETEPGHRHISHLFALFPSDSITEETPELFKAAKKTIARRVKYGKDGISGWGWSRAWSSLFYSRLKDGENAWDNLGQLISTCTETNMFNICPATGKDLFQIDGNLGGCAAIAEMLIQSHRGTVGDRIVEILPAIPKDWESGCVKGLKARGNFELDITWENCLPKEIVITSNTDNTLKIMLSEIMKGFKTSKEHSVDGDVLSIMMTEGEKVTINF